MYDTINDLKFNLKSKATYYTMQHHLKIIAKKIIKET